MLVTLQQWLRWAQWYEAARTRCPTWNRGTIDGSLLDGRLRRIVRDISAVYAEWSARGAEFLTPPKQHETELRCYVRDPDGHLIEVGQTTLPGGWRQFLQP